MRVLMLAPTPYFADRGCHVRIYEEAKTLIGLGCELRLVTYHIGRDMPGIPTLRIPRIPWYRRLTAGPSWQKPLLDLLLLFRALAVARTFKPQIIHAHLHEGAFIGLILKALLRIPLLMDFQGSLTVECRDHGFFRQGAFLDRIFSRIERLINDRVDALVTSSGAGAEVLLEQWGIPGHKVSAVIDGVDTDQFRPGDRDEARRELGIPADVSLVVYLGLLNRYQGLDVLLQAAEMLVPPNGNVHFLVMGYPEEEYRNRAAEMGIDHAVTFTGRVDYGQAARYLSAGDVAVSPKLSRTEANGKLFNYMACGLPTVVFDTPVNREILGDTGVYAMYGDGKDLAGKILDLLNDRESRAALAHRVREKACSQHSWEARGRRLMEIYQRLLSGDVRSGT